MKKLFILTILLLSQFSGAIFAECIEGDCVNGHGAYTLSGFQYVGEFKDGKEHGQGTLTFPSGYQYVGEWKDGYLYGQGTYTYAEGEQYVGEFKDDKKYGQGTYTFADGRQYVGEWKDDNTHGQGTFTWADGRQYVGEWKDGNYHGQGTFTWADGRQYVGEWKDDKQHGQGTFTYADGRQYVGEWKDSKFNGQGTLTWADGKIEVGIFEDGICKYDCTVEVSKGQPLVGIQCDEDHRAVIYGFESDGQLVFKNLRTLQKIPSYNIVYNRYGELEAQPTYRNFKFGGFQDVSVYNPIREVLDASLVFDDAHANDELLKGYEYDGISKSSLKNDKKPYQYLVSRLDFNIVHAYPTFRMDANRVVMNYESPDNYYWGGNPVKKDFSNSCLQKDAEELAAYMDEYDKELKEESEKNEQDTLKKRKF